MDLASMTVLRGRVGTEPRRFETSNGCGCSFRMASTRRYYDRNAQEWKDGPTLWITVKAFRTLAQNALASVHKGQPVIVAGMLAAEEWEDDGTQRFSTAVYADSLGHDLARGTSQFSKVARAGGEAAAEDAGEGAGGASASETGGGGVATPEETLEVVEAEF